jgi:hypothetical protein
MSERTQVEPHRWAEAARWLAFVDIEPELGAAVRRLAVLSSWYTAARYPDVEAGLQPSLQDVWSALTDLRDLRHQPNSLAPKHDGAP